MHLNVKKSLIKFKKASKQIKKQNDNNTTREKSFFVIFNLFHVHVVLDTRNNDFVERLPRTLTTVNIRKKEIFTFEWQK